MKKAFKFLFVLILLLFITSCDSPSETCELLGHEYEAIVTKPTCEKDGFTTYTCKYCKSSYIEDKINAIGHEILVVEELLATCENDGHTSGEKCTRCDYNTSVIISALGHDIVIDEKVEPTCENTGLTKGEHCTRCDYKVAQEVISALGHDIIIDEKVEPTCENTGLTKGDHCTRCDYKVAQEVIPALGHDIAIDEKVDPTCENAGLTSGEHCTRCDYKVAQEVIPALGHDIVIDEKVDPTCENAGLTSGEHCTRCDYKLVQKIIPALCHDFERVINSIAHRGYSSLAPENTLPAYVLAKEKGYIFVECDVFFTADGIPVLLHDKTIDRTSDGTGNVSDLTYEQLLQFDFGSWKSDLYNGTRIPTFDEFISLCVNLGLKPYIELKSDGSYTLEQIKQLNNIVEQYGLSNDVSWISFSSKYLKYVNAVNPNARLGFIQNTDVTQSVILTANELKTSTNEVFLLLKHTKLTNTGMILAMENNFPVEAHTINSTTDVLKLPRYVSGIITDSLIAQNIILDEISETIQPTCMEQGYSVYSCHCGEEYKYNFIDQINHNFVDDICSICGFIDVKWEQGTVRSADGVPYFRTDVIRTTNYLKLESFNGATINHGYQFLYFIYDSNNNYLGNGSSDNTAKWLKSGESFVIDDVLKLYPNGVYFRLIFKKLVLSEMSTDILADANVKFYSKDEQLPEKIVEIESEEFMEIIRCQDGAVYNNNAFIFNNSGKCTVYDLNTKSKTSSFTLDKVNLLNPHANAVFFGNEFYDESDEFPLLYVNIYNNYWTTNDRKEGICCVYRIYKDNDKFLNTLVQVVKIGFVENLNLWKSMENNGDYLPYGNFVVDTDKSKLYAFVLRDGTRTTRFFKFNLPKLNDGVYNEDYNCNVVTLHESDIEDMFDTKHFDIIQGCCYYQGKILALQGFGVGTYAEPALRVIDLSTKKVENTHWFEDINVIDEPELIYIDPITGLIYFATIDGILRTIKISEIK